MSPPLTFLLSSVIILCTCCNSYSSENNNENKINNTAVCNNIKQNLSEFTSNSMMLKPYFNAKSLFVFLDNALLKFQDVEMNWQIYNLNNNNKSQDIIAPLLERAYENKFVNHLKCIKEKLNEQKNIRNSNQQLKQTIDELSHINNLYNLNYNNQINALIENSQSKRFNTICDNIIRKIDHDLELVNNEIKYTINRILDFDNKNFVFTFFNKENNTTSPLISDFSNILNELKKHFDEIDNDFITTEKYNITKYKIIFKKIISQFKKLIELFNKELLFNNSGEVYENDIKNIIKNDIKSKIIKISDIEAEFLQYSNF